MILNIIIFTLTFCMSFLISVIVFNGLKIMILIRNKKSIRIPVLILCLVMFICIISFCGVNFGTGILSGLICGLSRITLKNDKTTI